MLEVKNIKKIYDGNLIFEDISFTIDEGERVGLYGISGCGKTTILRIIAGLEIADEGEVIIDGQLMSRNIVPYLRNISMAFQEPTLWNHMKVEDNISYGMETVDKEYIRYLAKRLGIEDILRKYPEQISGGQAKRVALARALACNRKYIFLDEPLSNIDKETKRMIMDFIKKEQLINKGVLYVSHNEEELSALGCRIVRL